MRLPFSLNAISRLVLLAVATTASAQDIFVTPIPGVPFSGIVTVERSLTQPDGPLSTSRQSAILAGTVGAASISS